MKYNLSDEEKFTLLDEYIDDDEYFYNNPLEELERKTKLKLILKVRNSIVISAVFFILIFIIGMWRTTSYGQINDGKYTFVNNERIAMLNYLERVEDLQEKELNDFVDNIKETNANSESKDGESNFYELGQNPIIKYKEYYRKYTFKEDVFTNYNEILLSVFEYAERLLDENQGYSANDDYNNIKKQGIKNNNLHYETDIEETDVRYLKALEELQKCKKELKDFLYKTGDQNE